MLDTGYRILDAGFSILQCLCLNFAVPDFNSPHSTFAFLLLPYFCLFTLSYFCLLPFTLVLDTGYWILDTECWILDTPMPEPGFGCGRFSIPYAQLLTFDF
jgi:hypothetical protein